MATAVLCGKGDVFFSPAGGRGGFSVFPAPPFFPFPQTAVRLSVRSGLFFCPGRMAFGKERAYDQKL